VSFSVVASTFGLMLVAELPDKTMIATLLMGSRSDPRFVWLGASAAFICQAALAVLAGKLLLLLPHDVLEAVVAGLFLAGAAYLLLVPERVEEEEGEAEAARERPARGWRVVLTAFGVIFVGEFGDLTQLLLVNLVGKTGEPLSVFVGGAAGLVSVAALGAFGGRFLLRILPVRVIRKVAGVVFLGFSAWTIYGLVSS
jgi:putative Ca2+/H+ antiporter (TMEM165/GDT1 family)